jgi:SepF-like predicted cell division protein (DUF552 family)
MRKKIFEVKNSIFGKKKKEEYVDVESPEYIEVTPEKSERSAKIRMEYFILTDFADVKSVIDSLRGGYTITLVKIKPLRDKDITELKRAIDKIKKTVDAINGEVVGIEEDYIVATPSFVSVYRGEAKPEL